MKDENRAPLFTDTFSLCEWLLRHLDREQSSLARAVCDNALKLLEVITFALKNRLREERLDEADERLIALRMQLRLAGSIGLFNERQMLFALECSDRIGRQLGGWQRALDAAQ
jgi:hypothetical protein